MAGITKPSFLLEPTVKQMPALFLALFSIFKNALGEGLNAFRIQPDGNMAIYGTDFQGIILWNSVRWTPNSNSNGNGVAPYRLVMQTNGNLRFFDSNDRLKWQLEDGIYLYLFVRYFEEYKN